MAAALSYYFVMAFFPALIFLSAVVTYLPVPDLFEKTIELMGHFIPHDSMGLVRQVLHDVVTPNRGALLSVGLLGTFWAASGGFSAAIEALNIAYDVDEIRPFWKTRPLAFALTLLVGILLLAAFRSDDCWAAIWGMDSGTSPFASGLDLALALHSLDHFCRFYHPCSRGNLFFSSQCKTEIPGYAPRRRYFSGILAWAFLSSRNLLSHLRQFK